MSFVNVIPGLIKTLDLNDSPPPIAQGNIKVIKPTWRAPMNVHGFTSTRIGGISPSPFNGLNLSITGADAKNNAIANRIILRQALVLPSEPVWLSQTHTTNVIDAYLTQRMNMGVQNADASFSNEPNIVCAVLTADCLPVLITNLEGTEVASIHAGWRGLCDGIIENTISALKSTPENILVWLGPAISPLAFEVGPEVRAQFIAQDATCIDCFEVSARQKGHFMADLYAIARRRLLRIGIQTLHISGGDYCTYTQKNWFFSYRRDGKAFGNLASVIWMSDHPPNSV